MCSPKALYRWRVRENQTSITQQTSDLDALRSWLHAAQSALAFLTSHEHHQARDARLVQFLRHDLQFRITAAQHGGDEYWEVLRRDTRVPLRASPVTGSQGICGSASNRCGAAPSGQV